MRDPSDASATLLQKLLLDGVAAISLHLAAYMLSSGELQPTLRPRQLYTGLPQAGKTGCAMMELVNLSHTLSFRRGRPQKDQRARAAARKQMRVIPEGFRVALAAGACRKAVSRRRERGQRRTMPVLRIVGILLPGQQLSNDVCVNGLIRVHGPRVQLRQAQGQSEK